MSDRRRMLFIAIIFGGASFAGATILLSGGIFGLKAHSLGGEFEFAALFTGIWLLIIGTGWLRQREQFDLFEPPVFISLIYYVQLVLNVWLLQRDWQSDSPWINTSNSPELALRVIFLICIGLSALWFSYIITFKKLASLPKTGVLHKRRLITVPRYEAIIAVWFIGWLVTLYATVTGLAGYNTEVGASRWGSYIVLIQLIGNVATISLMIRHFRQPNLTSWMWLTFVIIFQVFAGTLNGTKSAVFVLFYVFGAYYYVNKRVPWRIAGVAGVFVVLVIPSVNIYREILRERFDEGANFKQRIEAVQDAAAAVKGMSLGNLYEISEDSVSRRQGSPFGLSMAIMVVHPDFRPYLGQQILKLYIYRLVPRFLWPEKPTRVPDIYRMNTLYLGWEKDTSFSTPSLFGDVYRAGGWLLVPVFFSGLGHIWARLYYEGFIREKQAYVAFYLALLGFMFLADTNVLSILYKFIQYGIPTWFLTSYVLFRKIPQPDSIYNRNQRAS